MTVSIPETSVEYLEIPDVTATVDLTDQPVYVGVTTGPGLPTTWTPAEWAGTPGRRRTVRWRYPGNLPKGLYTVYVQVQAGDQTPILRAGSLRIS